MMMHRQYSCCGSSVSTRSLVLFASDLQQQQQVRLRFTIKQKLDYGRRLAVVGSPEELGKWNVSNTRGTLEWREGNIWSGETVMKPGPVEFKLVVVSDDEVVWPDGENVSLLIPESAGVVDVTGGGEEGMSNLHLTILEDATDNTAVDTQSYYTKTTTTTEHMEQQQQQQQQEELSLRFLQSLKVAELKVMCKERGLAVSGKKADLIDRLTNVS